MAAVISRWKMSEGRIGPNAILQLLPQIEALGGPQRVARMLQAVGLSQAPNGTQMIPEEPAARLHQLLRQEEPEQAACLAAQAGRDTARYILQHRIPKPVQTVLRLLPAPWAARMLSGAITKHAWTFAGSGQFARLDPWTFEIRDNPLVRGEQSETPLCHWHAAVFEELYQTLVHPGCRCQETACCAQPGVLACVFTLWIGTCPV